MVASGCMLEHLSEVGTPKEMNDSLMILEDTDRDGAGG